MHRLSPVSVLFFQSFKLFCSAFSCAYDGVIDTTCCGPGTSYYDYRPRQNPDTVLSKPIAVTKTDREKSYRCEYTG